MRHDGKPVPSLPHIEMTVAMLRDAGRAGRRLRRQPLGGRARDRSRRIDEAIEPDLSNAAPFLALAATTGGTVTVRDWPARTTQPGDALRDVLARMGCTVEDVTGPTPACG